MSLVESLGSASGSCNDSIACVSQVLGMTGCWATLKPQRMKANNASTKHSQSLFIDAAPGTVCKNFFIHRLHRLSDFCLRVNYFARGWHSTHWNIEMSPRLTGCLKGSLALWQVSHLRSDNPPRSTGCLNGIDSGVVAGRAESDNTV